MTMRGVLVTITASTVGTTTIGFIHLTIIVHLITALATEVIGAAPFMVMVIIPTGTAIPMAITMDAMATVTTTTMAITTQIGCTVRTDEPA